MRGSPVEPESVMQILNKAKARSRAIRRIAFVSLLLLFSAQVCHPADFTMDWSLIGGAGGSGDGGSSQVDSSIGQPLVDLSGDSTNRLAGGFWSFTLNAPRVSKQPLSVTNAPGSTAKFAVIAADVAPFNYQWLFNGAAILNATNPAYTRLNVQSGVAGSYSVLVGNLYGVVPSDEAQLFVGAPTPPLIITQPLSRTVSAGSNVAFSVSTTGSDPRFYQWQFEGTNIANATNSSYTVVNAQGPLEGTYRVIVTNFFGAVTSSNALLAVNDSPPVIITQPLSRTNAAGTTAAFTVKVIGTAPLSFQWSFDGVVVPNGTNASLSVADVQRDDAGSYSVRVSNAFGFATSSNALLSVIETAPIIVTQPQNKISYTGSSAKFSVKAIGSEPLGYQWRKAGVEISFATNSTYARTNIHTSDEDAYSVVVSNALGWVISAEATLTVDDRFVRVAGAYNGLFYETNTIRHHSSGFITMTLSESGSANGKILCDGSTNSFSGNFDASGTFQKVVLRPNKTSLTLTLQVDLTNDADQIIGTISDGVWTAQLLADRATFSATNTTSLAGFYTIVLPGSNSATIPFGHSYGLISVSNTGSLKLAGTLADGAAVSQTVSIGRTGEWPFYVPLYGGRGSLLGWLTLLEAPRRIEGRVSWIKTNIDPTNQFYASGFTNELEILSSGYRVPVPATRAVNMTNAIVILAGCNWPSPSTNFVTVNTNNTITVASPNPRLLKLTITTSSGYLSGSVVDPLGRTNVIKGALLQNQNQAAGFFLGTNQSGSVLLTLPSD
jgi:hypothetical protein